MGRGNSPFLYEYGQSQRRNVVIGKGPYLMTNRIPALTPNLTAAGLTMVNSVLTTIPMTTLTKNRVTTSTYTNAQAVTKIRHRKPAVTLGSSQVNSPATRSKQEAAWSNTVCDIVIMANTSSICFCSAAKGLRDSHENVSFGASAFAFAFAAFSFAAFFSLKSFALRRLGVFLFL